MAKTRLSPYDRALRLLAERARGHGLAAETARRYLVALDGLEEIGGRVAVEESLAASAIYREAQCTPRERSLVALDGTPKYVRIYDNGGETYDRYTVVFTGKYRCRTGGGFWYMGVSAHGFVTDHGESDRQIDRPAYSHLGRKIRWSALPTNIRVTVEREYRYLWGLPKRTR